MKQRRGVRVGRILGQKKIRGIGQYRVEKHSLHRRPFVFQLQRSVAVEPRRHVDLSRADEIGLLGVSRNHSGIELGEVSKIV